MNSKIAFFIMLAVAVVAGPLQAENPSLPGLPPGSYLTTVTPSLNKDVAHRIEHAWGKIPGIGKVTTNLRDDTIRFTVKDGARVDAMVLQQTLTAVYTEAVMVTPELTNSSDPELGY